MSQEYKYATAINTALAPFPNEISNMIWGYIVPIKSNDDQYLWHNKMSGCNLAIKESSEKIIERVWRLHCCYWEWKYRNRDGIGRVI